MEKIEMECFWTFPKSQKIKQKRAVKQTNKIHSNTTMTKDNYMQDFSM